MAIPELMYRYGLPPEIGTLDHLLAVAPGPEAIACIEFADRMRGWTLDTTFNGIWFHPAGEGNRGKLATSILKRMGHASRHP